jgi:hypothetical protein
MIAPTTQTIEAAGAVIGEDGLVSVDRRYCFGASGATWSDDMVSGFVICSFAACFVVIGLFVVPIWSDDMWSADIASGFAVTSSAKATLVEATAPKATKAAAPMKIFSLEIRMRVPAGPVRRFERYCDFAGAAGRVTSGPRRHLRLEPKYFSGSVTADETKRTPYESPIRPGSAGRSLVSNDEGLDRGR